MLGVYARLYHKRDAVYERYCAAHRYERVHIRRAVDKALCAAHEKLAVDNHNHERQHEFVYGNRHRVVLERQRPVPHNHAHRNVHKRQEQCDRNRKANHHNEYGIHFVFFFGFIAREGGFVTCFRHRFAYVFCRERCVVLDEHRVGQKTDAYALYAVERAHDFLDSRRASRTRHSRYVEFLFFHTSPIISFS